MFFFGDFTIRRLLSKWLQLTVHGQTVTYSSVRPPTQLVVVSAGLAITTVNRARHVVDYGIALVPPH